VKYKEDSYKRKIIKGNKMISKINYIPPEKDNGSCEYKLKLVYGNHISEEVRNKKLIKTASQMKYRLYQGKGKAIYILGVSDNGDVEGITKDELDESIIFLESACKLINAQIYRKRMYEGKNGFIGTLRIEILDIRSLDHEFI
jgi:elongation factor 1-alpha